MTEVAAVAIWYLGLQALSLSVAPLVFRAFGPLPDRGLALSKVSGWLMVGIAVWLLGMLGLLQFTRPTVIAVMLGIGAACWWRWGSATRTALSQRSSWLAGEIVFALAFLIAVWIRAHTPDIAGQEKFMDFAIMNSFLTHAQLPAPDPWLSGYGMPYYHLIYFMFALVAKLSGSSGPVAFNLAVATVFALGSVGAFSLAANLTRLSRPAAPLLAGLAGALAALFVLVIGNLEALFEILSIHNAGGPGLWSAIGIKGLAPGQPAAGWWPADGGWWWRASRVVPTTKPDGINEFPYFSFLLGDLHPHFMAIPLDLLVMALAITVLVSPAQLRSWPWRVLSVFALGALIPGNTWDLPVFWGLFVICGMLAAARRQQLRQGVTTLAGVFVAAVVAVAPYTVGYTSQPLGIGIVDEHTPLPSFLVIFGAFALISIVWLVFPPTTGSERRSPRWVSAIPIVGAVLAVLASAMDMRALGLVVVLDACCLHRLIIASYWNANTEPPPISETVTALLLTIGYAVIAATEILFIRDSFGTRMNTVFKFHYNAWLLLALGCAIAIVTLIAHGGMRRATAVLASGLVLLLGGIYPLGATLTKTNHFQATATLDGSSFARRQYENDLSAVDWLGTVSQPRASVVEAVGGDYTDFGRVSTFSGMPTPIGWIGHELQWRGPMDELTRRERLVQSLYQARDAEAAQSTLDVLGASYIFVGRLEREKYGAEAVDRLRSWLPVAYQHGDALVLRRATETPG
ncbi:MAG TPA: DUF2298 domain-containing protein [Chloroflexota bacterium]|nr:DUF2298 domain-containing protein [Chloroflexota bacterium]